MSGKRSLASAARDMQQPGYFVFSLDMELAWGDLWSQPNRHSSRRDSMVERAAIRRLLDLMSEYDVRATWAFTGHVLYNECEKCSICPIEDLRGKDPRFEQIWGTSDGMWYGADILDEVLSRNAGHEIACHGYTHRYFDRLSRDEARFEIQEWLRLAERRGLDHFSVIFPQGRIGHLDLFREAGFLSYRGKEVRHPALSLPLLGKVLNRLNLKLSFLTPQAFDITCDDSGLVNIPSSQWLFRTNRDLETALDSMGMQKLRFRGTARAIRTAAEDAKVIHLWAHPHEFRTDRDFEKLRFLFDCYASASRAGQLRSVTMAELAQHIRAKEPSVTVKGAA